MSDAEDEFSDGEDDYGDKDNYVDADADADDSGP